MDVVERLRKQNKSATARDGADRIEALEKALREIIDRSNKEDAGPSQGDWKAGYVCGWDDASAIARAALGEGELDGCGASGRRHEQKERELAMKVTEGIGGLVHALKTIGVKELPVINLQGSDWLRVRHAIEDELDPALYRDYPPAAPDEFRFNGVKFKISR